jgi:hypothetical protein
MGEAKRRREAFYSQRDSDKLGDAPVEQRYYAQMTAIMRTMDEFINGGLKGDDRHTGIVVLMFPFGEADSGRTNFMSNGANRQDVVTLMKEMIARFEGQPETKGTA